MSTFTTIGALISGLPRKYGNRLDIASIADGSDSVSAVVEAINELSETFEFEELKTISPVPPATTLALSVGQPIVPISTILASIQGNALYPQFQGQNITDITDIYTFWMWFAGGPNQAGRTLEYRRVTTVDQDSFGITSNTQGAIGTAPPVYYTRFGNLLQVGPSPDQPYQFFVRVKIRHPFPINFPFIPAVLTPVIVSGFISQVLVTSGGSGYLPTAANIPIVFSTPIGGTTAIATGFSNAFGQLTNVAVTFGGTGYIPNNASVNTAIIASQPVFVPPSWREIIQYAALWRLATWNGSEEYIAMFDNVLKSKMAGVQEARTAVAQMVRDEKHNSRSLSLRLGGPYTFARR